MGRGGITGLLTMLLLLAFPPELPPVKDTLAVEVLAPDAVDVVVEDAIGLEADDPILPVDELLALAVDVKGACLALLAGVFTIF
jgi:hypothetical protein